MINNWLKLRFKTINRNPNQLQDRNDKDNFSSLNWDQTPKYVLQEFVNYMIRWRLEQGI